MAFKGVLVFAFVLALLQSAATLASTCPSDVSRGDVETIDSCSKSTKSAADWGKCLTCSNVCERLQSTTGCLLSYSQVLNVVTGKTCDIDPTTCSTAFGATLNATCAAAPQSTAPCASQFPLVPVIAGSVGGGVALCVFCLGYFEYRRRVDREEAKERRQRRQERKAREAENYPDPNAPPGRQKWRPSFVQRTRAVVSEMSKHQSLRYSNAMVANSGLSPMSSAPPMMVSHNSFRGPPPMASHNSFRGPPPMVSHGSFRGPPQGPPPLAAHNSFRGMPQMTSHNSFRGPPPMQSHPSYGQMPHMGAPGGGMPMMAPGMPSHNSFHGAPPQLQAHNSFHGAPAHLQAHNSFHGAVPGGFPGGPGMMMPPSPAPQMQPQFAPGATHPPPIMAPPAAPAVNVAPPVPPSRNSGVVTKPAAAPAAPSGGGGGDSGGEENSLLAQIKAGKQLRKAKAEEKKDEPKKPTAAAKPAAAAEPAGGAGGLMAELQRKMKKKRGSVVE